MSMCALKNISWVPCLISGITKELSAVCSLFLSLCVSTVLVNTTACMFTKHHRALCQVLRLIINDLSITQLTAAQPRATATAEHSDETVVLARDLLKSLAGETQIL